MNTTVNLIVSKTVHGGKVSLVPHPESHYSYNVYFQMLAEYVKIMQLEDCFACFYLPASAAERAAYFHLSLSYSSSCTVLLNLFYQQNSIRLFYTDYDRPLENVPNMCLWSTKHSYSFPKAFKPRDQCVYMMKFFFLMAKTSVTN